jgi:abhydrolase domain-containing protein 12
MPLGLYAKHESEIIRQPPGCAEDITKTKAFRLLRDDPDARLIINCMSLCNESLFHLSTDIL